VHFESQTITIYYNGKNPKTKQGKEYILITQGFSLEFNDDDADEDDQEGNGKEKRRLCDKGEKKTHFELWLRV